MKLFKFKFVHPIGKKQFQFHVAKAVLTQFAIVLMTVSIYPQVNKALWGVIFFVSYILICVYLFDFNKFRSRYKDIHPDQELNPFYFVLSWFFPVWFYGQIAYLCLKESDSSPETNRLFKIRYALPLGLCLTVLQFVFPTLGYWTGLASNYYVADVYQDAMNIVAFKEKAVYGKNVLDVYKLSNRKQLTSTEIILLVAVDANVIIREKKRRDIANELEKNESSVQIALELLDSTKKSLIYSEEAQERLLDFSFVHWMHPTGPIEVMLLTHTDHRIIRKFCPVLLSKSFSILDATEKKIQKLKGSKKKAYWKRVTKLREEFRNTKTYNLYRSPASTK